MQAKNVDIAEGGAHIAPQLDWELENNCRPWLVGGWMRRRVGAIDIDAMPAARFHIISGAPLEVSI